MQSHDRVCMYQNPQKEKINVVFTQNGARMREALTDTEKKKKKKDTKLKHQRNLCLTNCRIISSLGLFSIATFFPCPDPHVHLTGLGEIHQIKKDLEPLI